MRSQQEAQQKTEKMEQTIDLFIMVNYLIITFRKMIYEHWDGEAAKLQKNMRQVKCISVENTVMKTNIFPLRLDVPGMKQTSIIMKDAEMAIVFCSPMMSNDGLIFATYDHYMTFYEISLGGTDEDN